MNTREPSPVSPQGRLSLPLALCLAIAVAALVVFAVPRVADLAHERSRYTAPSTKPPTPPAGRNWLP